MSIHKRPDWLVQTEADLDRHEGFREFAYPDPLSKLFRRHPRARWGFRPADIIMAELGETSNEREGRPWTVGHGFTSGVRPSSRISREHSRKRLEKEILEHLHVLEVLIPEWKEMPLFAQTVLVNMAYNMGLKRLSQFAPTLAVFKQRKWGRAARRLEKTLWYKQVGVRSRELCDRLLNQRIAPQHLVVKEPHHTIDTGFSCIYIGDKEYD